MRDQGLLLGVGRSVRMALGVAMLLCNGLVGAPTRLDAAPAIVHRVAIEVDGPLVVDDASAGLYVFSQGQLVLFDTRSGQERRTMWPYLTSPDDPVTVDMALAPRRHLLVLGDVDGNVVFIDVHGWKVRRQVNVSGMIDSVLVDERADMALVAISASWAPGGGPSIVALSLNTGTVRATYRLPAHTDFDDAQVDAGAERLFVSTEHVSGPLTHLAFSPGPLLLLDTATLRPVARWTSLSASTVAVVDPSHHVVVVIYWNKRIVEMRDLRQGHRVWRVASPNGQLALINGHVLIDHSQNGGVDVRAEATGRLITTYHLPDSAFDSIVPDGIDRALIATNPPPRQGGRSMLTLIDLRTERIRWQLPLPVTSADDLAASASIGRAFVLSQATETVNASVDELLFLQVPLS